MSTTKEDITVQEVNAEQSGAAAEMAAKKMGFGKTSKQIGAWVRRVLRKKQKAEKEAKADANTPTDGAPAVTEDAPTDGVVATTPATAIQA